MTNPILALETTNKIGRVYQLPGGGYTGKLSTKTVTKGIAEKTLFPSITNVQGTMDKGLEDYHKYMFFKAIENGYSSYDAFKASEKYRENTAKRGTLIHKWIEEMYDLNILKNWFIDSNSGRKLDSLSETTKSDIKKMDSYKEIMDQKDTFIIFTEKYNSVNFIKSFIAFMNDMKPNFIMSEATVYGNTEDNLGYAGTTDFIAEINGETYIGDFKTSAYLSASTSLQLAAISNAHSVTTDFTNLIPMPRISNGIGVNIRKDGSYKIYKADMEAGWKYFEGLRRNWELKAFEGKGLIEVIAEGGNND